MYFLNSSPVGPPGFTAILASDSRTPASANALPISVVSLATIASAVPAGTKKPLHNCEFTSGNPASAMLGTSGSSGERSDPVTAKARILPLVTSGIDSSPNTEATSRPDSFTVGANAEDSKPSR